MPHQSPWKRKKDTPYSKYDALENINKTFKYSSRAFHTNETSLQKVKKCWKAVTRTHELEIWLPLGTMRPAADREVLFVNQSLISVSRHWATQLRVSLGRTSLGSSSFKRYDSKDGLPNKPHCLQQVMITRKIDKVKKVATMKRGWARTPLRASLINENWKRRTVDWHDGSEFLIFVNSTIREIFAVPFPDSFLGPMADVHDPWWIPDDRKPRLGRCRRVLLFLDAVSLALKRLLLLSSIRLLPIASW